MQLSVPWRMGQSKPFGSIPRINRSHPLAQGLVFYGYDSGTGAVLDLVAGRTQTVIGTAIASGPTPYGSGLLYGGATSVAFASDDAIRAPSLTGELSFACAYFQTATVGSFSTPFNRTAENAGAAPFLNYAFEINPLGGGDFHVDYLCDIGGSGTSFTSAFWANNAHNVFTSLAGVIDSANVTGYAYAQGDLVGSNNKTTVLANDNTNDAVIFSGGSSAGVSLPFIGSIYYGAIWNRLLSAEEVLQLHNDPYCFLIYPEDEIFASLVSAAAVAQAPFLAEMIPLMMRQRVRATAGTPQ